MPDELISRIIMPPPAPTRRMLPDEARDVAARYFALANAGHRVTFEAFAEVWRRHKSRSYEDYLVGRAWPWFSGDPIGFVMTFSGGPAALGVDLLATICELTAVKID